MNLRFFLCEVDKISKDMPASELQAFVHETGRTLPERFRKSYIDTLKSYSSSYKDKSDADKSGAVDGSGNIVDFQKRYGEIRGQLEQISEGELYIGGELNYEYDDWYDNGEEFELSDTDGVADIIYEACGFVHNCIGSGEYGWGYQLAEFLMGLEIYVEIEGGYDFYDNLRIKDLEHYGIGDIDYKGFVIDALYCGYLANDIKSRPDVLYSMIRNSDMEDISLEMIMQTGDELTDVGEFLAEWIAYLGKLDGADVQALLKEALELAGDQEVALNSARLYCDLHPSLYEHYIDGMARDKSPLGDIFRIGEEALEKIGVQYVARSRIAKKISALALKDNQKERAEKYWLEAFRSETNVSNFMVMCSLCGDCGSYLGELRKIYRGMYEKAGNYAYQSGRAGELKPNAPDINNIYMLAILGGEYQYVKEHAMDVEKALGWSSTFMKCGIAAFLLVLYEGGELQAAGKVMCSRIVSSVSFGKDEFETYIGECTEMDSASLFWRWFREWKQRNAMGEEEKLKYLKWLDKMIQKRVGGIMGANRRNYYGECASFVAALGEVLESWGESGAKQSVMMEYKMQYSRRSAFHSELRNYGMKDARKRK